MIPNSILRRSYINTFPQYKIYDISIPNDEITPELYLTINDVVLNEYENYKEGNDWLLATSINIWKENEKGFVSSVELEEVANDIISTLPIVQGFKLHHREMFDCKQFALLETDTNTIERTVIIFKHWLSYEG